MKQLLWLGSISCSLLAMLILPSQASSLELKSDASFWEFNEIFHNAVTEVAITTSDEEIVADSNLPVEIESLETLPVVSPSNTQPEEKSIDSELMQPIEVSSIEADFLPSIISLPPVAEPVQQVPSKNVALANNEQVQLIEQQSVNSNNAFTVSPGLSISNPIGFGADNNVAFLAASYQSRTRGTTTRDGELGLGVGLGDAVSSVGVEISYSINSFGSSNGFGTGGFNAKIHKRLAEGTAVAIGWNRFLNIVNERGTGVSTDFPNNSYYAVASHIIRTKESTDELFSRVSFSGGIGGGQFLPFETTSVDLNAGGLNVFGSVALRVAKPVSAILEWTGQDLTAGLSITPLGENFPLVVTPAFRDISGVSGEGRRFVLGVGTGFKF
jgi:hypothetical protein